MMAKTSRILHWVQEDGELVLFANGANEDKMPETQLWLPSSDWIEMGEPRELTVTIHPGDQLNLQGDRRPHSRACGFRKHDHGPECARDCPTCNSPANAIAGEKLAD